jgi:hypothetical protein
LGCDMAVIAKVTNKKAPALTAWISRARALVG